MISGARSSATHQKCIYKLRSGLFKLIITEVVEIKVSNLNKYKKSWTSAPFIAALFNFKTSKDNKVPQNKNPVFI